MSPEKTTLQLRRVYAAPRERVFRAWIEPESLQKWFRPSGIGVTVMHMEPQVGGSYQFETVSPDGARIITSGRYLEVSFPEKLVFTWLVSTQQGQETVVTIEFIDHGASTELILTHDRFLPGTSLTLFRQGWTSILDHLADDLAAAP